MKRYTTAIWSGNVKEGNEYLISESKAYQRLEISLEANLENSSS